MKHVEGSADTTRVGIGLMILTTATFAASDSTVKVIGAAVPLLAMLWVRYLFQTIVMGSMLVRSGSKQWHPGSFKLQIFRAVALLANSACTFAGLRLLPLSVTTSLAMLAPIVSTLLAAVVLNDSVSKARWALVILGFIGMILIVRPGGEAFDWAVAFPLGAAVTFACFQVVSSHLSKSADATTTNFLTALVATVILTLLVWIGQAQLRPDLARVPWLSWFLVIVMATIATTGHLFMLQALRRAPLSLLTPFAYAQLAFAALFGWMLFGQVPDGWTAAGMIVIATSGVLTVVLANRQPSTVDPREVTTAVRRPLPLDEMEE
jgi:drug/metabolite transporter (DMT)-like permease